VYIVCTRDIDFLVFDLENLVPALKCQRVLYIRHLRCRNTKQTLGVVYFRNVCKDLGRSLAIEEAMNIFMLMELRIARGVNT